MKAFGFGGIKVLNISIGKIIKRFSFGAAACAKVPAAVHIPTGTPLPSLTPALTATEDPSK